MTVTTAQAVGDRVGGAVVVALDVEPGDEAWLAARRRGLGGSDAAVVAGMSRWRGPYELYAQKRGELPEADETSRMRRGRDLEPLIAEWFASESGLVLCNPRALLRSARWPWMLATPDRLVGPSLSEASEGVEIKATGLRGASDWHEGEVPDEAYWQCVHYLAVTGFARWHLVGLAGGTDDLAHVVIEASEAPIAPLAKVEGDFWQRVLDGRPPAPDGKASTAAALAARWPDADPTATVEVGADVLTWITKRAEAKAALEVADTALRDAESHIKAAIGDASIATHEGRTVATWKWQDRAAHEVKASRSRVLRVSKGATE
jgi:putative phage-type endonuclease